MKYRNINFPYPVLRKDDDSIKSNIDLFHEEFERENDYLIRLHFKIDNEDILKLINEDKAEYVIEIFCSDTLLRKIYTTKHNKLEITLDKTEVKGKVNIESFVLAKEEILNYKNKDAHPDYNDFVISLQKGDILAYFDGFSFTAQIDYKKLKAVASFMEIDEGTQDTVYVELDSDKIIIFLPQEDYKIYTQDFISNEQKFVPVIHSSLVTNALLIALYNMNKYPERLWAQALQYRLETEKELEGISVEDVENIPKIAQILLGKPFTRLMKGLEALNGNNNE